VPASEGIHPTSERRRVGLREVEWVEHLSGDALNQHAPTGARLLVELVHLERDDRIARRGGQGGSASGADHDLVAENEEVHRQDHR